MAVKKKAKTMARKAKKTKTAKKAKVVAKKVSAKTTPIKDAMKKSQLMQEISDVTALSKKQVSAVFEELGNVMSRHFKKGGAGEFVMPGLIKCVIKRKPATKARQGINPFTGETITFKAKPARNIIKVRALKRLKAMVD